MSSIAIAALAVITGCAITLYALGRRFARGYVARYGVLPPGAWILRRTTDPELEELRRFALLVLPFQIVAIVVYLFRP